MNSNKVIKICPVCHGSKKNPHRADVVDCFRCKGTGRMGCYIYIVDGKEYKWARRLGQLAKTKFSMAYRALKYLSDANVHSYKQIVENENTSPVGQELRKVRMLREYEVWLEGAKKSGDPVSIAYREREYTKAIKRPIAEFQRLPDRDYPQMIFKLRALGYIQRVSLGKYKITEKGFIWLESLK